MSCCSQARQKEEISRLQRHIKDSERAAAAADKKAGEQEAKLARLQRDLEAIHAAQQQVEEDVSGQVGVWEGCQRSNSEEGCQQPSRGRNVLCRANRPMS